MFATTLNYLNHIKIDQRPGVIPAVPESCDFIHYLLSLEWTTCLDLGCGTGVLGISLADPGKQVTCTDIDPQALELTLHNAAKNKRTVTTKLSSWYDSLEGEWDLIVANPPHATIDEYATAPNEFKQWVPERAVVGGPKGLHHIVAVIEQAPDYLKSGGYLAVFTDTLMMSATEELGVWAGLEYIQSQTSSTMSMSLFRKP